MYYYVYSIPNRKMPSGNAEMSEGDIDQADRQDFKITDNSGMHGGVIVRALDLWWRGRSGFDSRSGGYLLDGWLSVDR